ncbi:MAG: polyprenyl synthetase family protein [Clostridia bacterium]|nr:polyprenyl synthetase family protein [Clostridia bacterium]
MSFSERLALHAEMTEKRLKELLTPVSHNGTYLCSPRLYEAMRYATLGGGKRLRAFLALQFCLANGGSAENALDYACAIEMTHAFSLVHDDLPAMDDDDMRRGKPSAHMKYGEATAILAGDALAIDAFRVIAGNKKCTSAQNAEAANCLAWLAGGYGMCGGQQLDLDGEGKTLSEREISLLVERKTCDLIAAACYLGAVAASKKQLTSDERATALTFGTELGFAFQITDDLLDIHSTPEKLGKTVGKDEKEQKSTYVSLLGEEGARKKAEDCICIAKQQLEKLPESVYREELFELCDFVLTRDH